MQRKHERGETASYDGDESPVSETDVLVARAFTALTVAIYVYSQFVRH